MLNDSLRALRSGHWPTLLGAWLHFEVSFMVWLLIGALGIAISDEFALSASQKGILVGTPLLGGAILRIIVGPLADWLGAKYIGIGILGLEVLALALGWLWGTSFEAMLGVGLLLGFAGASFAIALPLASQAYPPAHQGLAMGVAAVGNSGVLLATMIAPRLAEAFGWRTALGWMIVPVIMTGLVFLLLVRPKSRHHRQTVTTAPSSFRAYLSEGLQDKFMYWLCALYGVTFGGFVGFSSYLPIFFHDQFQVGMVLAGTLTAACALAGSVARPLGGYVADRFGGLTFLYALFLLVAGLCLIPGYLPSMLGTLMALLALMICLGFGNGVIFQVASHRFDHMMGTASGLIGAAGGLGGFFLPSWFGWLKDSTGSFEAGFWVFGLVSGLAGISAMIVGRVESLGGHKSIQGNSR